MSNDLREIDELLSQMRGYRAFLVGRDLEYVFDRVENPAEYGRVKPVTVWFAVTYDPGSFAGRFQVQVREKISSIARRVDGYRLKFMKTEDTGHILEAQGNLKMLRGTQTSTGGPRGATTLPVFGKRHLESPGLRSAKLVYVGLAEARAGEGLTMASKSARELWRGRLLEVKIESRDTLDTWYIPHDEAAERAILDDAMSQWKPF